MNNVNEYEKNLLSLLIFALDKRGVSKSKYVIGVVGDELKHEDKICLIKEKNGSWSTLYIERGCVSQKILHPSFRDAVTIFFWKLDRRDTPWDYRIAWEKETGLEL